MINVTISGIEEAKRQLDREIKKLASDKTVLVGIHEDAGSTDDGDLTMAQLGAIQHFGADINHPGGTSYGYKTQKDAKEGKVRFLGKGKGYMELGVTKPHKITIPPRPWLDVGVQSGTQDYLEVIQNHSDDIDNALEIIGQIAVGKVQDYMTNLSAPPNAKSTVAKKGSSNPLIDTGALRQSVTYSITNTKTKEGLG